jgi:hypothetical protein
MAEKSFGKQLAATLITPCAPQAIKGSEIWSSPLTIKKPSGMFFKMCMHCIMLPLASFIPATFSHSCARRKVVSAVILLPVRPGTLYKITGSGEAAAIAL